MESLQIALIKNGNSYAAQRVLERLLRRVIPRLVLMGFEASVKISDWLRASASSLHRASFFAAVEKTT